MGDEFSNGQEAAMSCISIKFHKLTWLTYLILLSAIYCVHVRFQGIILNNRHAEINVMLLSMSDNSPLPFMSHF